MIKLREFIAGLGGAVAWPLAARAQRPAVPVIGFLNPGLLHTTRELVAAVHRGLSSTGYVEGRNLAVEYRWAEYRSDRLTVLADDLVRRQVAVIFAVASAAGVAKAATKSIPIVFVSGNDPVATGLVASLNRPGGNLTGISILNTAVAAKRLELLHELVPTASLLAFVADSTSPTGPETETRELQAAARTLGVRLLILNASDPSEFEAAFAALVHERAGGLVVGSNPLFGYNTGQLIALAARYAVPTVYAYRENTAAGGLTSYGTDHLDAYRQAGDYIDRILKGDKPSDLPVQLVTKIELVINMKTAKSLGLTFPLTLLGRADAAIE
jgi:putative tryptophan/tyrosine transport system substrate-binding protein